MADSKLVNVAVVFHLPFLSQTGLFKSTAVYRGYAMEATYENEYCSAFYTLLGDHQQLKPNPTVYELAKDYNLDLSLFERMINNKFPVVTLDTQHRMRPEVSVYLKYIYEVLHDHLSVFGREPIRGLSTPVYFFNHKSRERSDPGTMSHSNEFEADMITALTRYLLGQNYDPSEITIISMYTGQLLLLKSKMPRSEFDGVKITSVDNFQGEENTIVIVSLVRCNEKDILGFVKVENRICVALSRAKFGMYVFGDFNMFSRGSPLWKKIAEEARRADRVGSAFNLSCGKHGNKATVSKAEDFKLNAPSGGCTLTCGERLLCGHKCTWFCHSTDPEHEGFKCQEKCERKLENCNHPCATLCYKTCPRCMVPKTVVLACGHKRTVPCHQPDHTVECIEPCPETLSCSHKCLKRCSEPCTNPCVKLVDEVCSRCGEIKKIECHINTARLSGDVSVVYECDTPCTSQLSCGHPCQGTCYSCAKLHKFCEAECGASLKCGHKCKGVCSLCEHMYDNKHHDCMEICSKQLECGHKCNKKCWECFGLPECPPCNQKCLLRCSHREPCQKLCQEECFFPHNKMGKKTQKCQRGCKHDKCQRSCAEACSHTPCDKECDRNIQCSMCKRSYKCLGLCGEPCPYICPNCDLSLLVKKIKDIPDMSISDGTRWIYLTDCRHRLPVPFMDVHVYSKPHGSLVLCPMHNCEMPVLNTPRYVPVTRLKKNQQNEESAKLRLEREKQKGKKMQGINPMHATQSSTQPQVPKRLTMEDYHKLTKQMKDANWTVGGHHSQPLPDSLDMESLQRTLEETVEATQELKEEGERMAAARQAKGAKAATGSTVKSGYGMDVDWFGGRSVEYIDETDMEVDTMSDHSEESSGYF